MFESTQDKATAVMHGPRSALLALATVLLELELKLQSAQSMLGRGKTRRVPLKSY